MNYLNPGLFSKSGYFGGDQIQVPLGWDQMSPWTFWIGPSVSKSYVQFHSTFKNLLQMFIDIYIYVYIYILFNPHLRICLLVFREREKHDVRNIHRLPPVCTLSGD